jgi:hypothetical protein
MCFRWDFRVQEEDDVTVVRVRAKSQDRKPPSRRASLSQMRPTVGGLRDLERQVGGEVERELLDAVAILRR